MKQQNSFFTWRVLLVVMALLLMTTGVALAQDTPVTPDPAAPAAQGYGMRNGQGAGMGSQFMDADGDGQCDNFVDADGDGVCDNAGAGMMRGQNQAGMRGQAMMQGRNIMRGMHNMLGDQGMMQGDGMRGMHSGQGMMQGQGGMRGQGQGLNQGNGPLFEDADGDGVCDHMQSAPSTDN